MFKIRKKRLPHFVLLLYGLFIGTKKPQLIPGIWKYSPGVWLALQMFGKVSKGGAAFFEHFSAAEGGEGSHHSFAQETWHGMLLCCQKPAPWPSRQQSLSQADPTPLLDLNLESWREGMVREESSQTWEVWAGRHRKRQWKSNSQKSVY